MGTDSVVATLVFQGEEIREHVEVVTADGQRIKGGEVTIPGQDPRGRAEELVSGWRWVLLGGVSCRLRRQGDGVGSR